MNSEVFEDGILELQGLVFKTRHFHLTCSGHFLGRPRSLTLSCDGKVVFVGFVGRLLSQIKLLSEIE